MNYKVIPYDKVKGRFQIIDENGKVIDTAQGYGYKSEHNAHKAASWKFNGGKEKSENSKKEFKEWLKVEENKKFYDKFEEDLIYWAIAAAKNGEHFSTSEFTKLYQEQTGITIPNFVLSQFR